MISVLLLLAACSTSTDGPNTDPDTDLGTDTDTGSDSEVETASTSATIDANGGSLSLEMVTVDIPAGALTDATEITLTVAGDSGDADALTPIFELEPHGQVFAEPVTLTFDVAEGPAQVVRSDDDTTYLPLATERGDDGVEVNVDGFSWFYVTNPASLCDGCQLTRGGQSLDGDEAGEVTRAVMTSDSAPFTATPHSGDRIRLSDDDDRCLTELVDPDRDYGQNALYDASLVQCVRIAEWDGQPGYSDFYPDMRLVSDGNGSVRIVSGTGRCLMWLDGGDERFAAFMDCGSNGVVPEGWTSAPQPGWELVPAP